MSKLHQYQHKRNFAKTSEPAGTVSRLNRAQPIFVVQKHAARRLHYDFRLELDGVLKSWAVPKGPSFDPAVKSLAVHVEDHPMEYGGFEGTIPEGEYGGGTVMLWDRGSWAPFDDPNKAYRKGRLRFRLEGERLKGEWNLVRMGGRAGEGGKNWLLIKSRDRFAIPDDGHRRIEGYQTSVRTGRTMAQIAGTDNHVERNGRPQTRRRKLPKLDIAAVPGARKRRQPAFLTPQFATLAAQIPEGDDWLHELKLDGYRLVCVKQNDNVQLFTRRGQDWTDEFPTIAAAITRLPVEQAILDGEVVVLAKDGTTNFQALQNSLRANRVGSHLCFLFDLPHCDGYDLTQSPLIRRKELLASLLRNLPKDGPLRYSDHIQGHGRDVIKNACRHALEGTVSKQVDSKYVPKRSRQWIKVKCRKRQEFVIGGWSDPEGGRTHFGSLLLGWYDGSELRYCGRVGTGFTGESLKAVSAELKKRPLAASPFATAPPRSRSVHWVKPELVAEIEFANWTEDGILRQTAFLGLREDKRATEVTREEAVAMKDAKEKPTKASKVKASTHRESFEGVRLTHPERVLFPDQGLTKKDLAEYYTAVADRALPYLIGRPLTIVRCPEGRKGDCFYQRHVSSGIPKHIYPIAVEESEGVEQCLSVRDRAGLISLVQLSALEIHVWGSRQEDVEKPDRLVFDLDPDTSVSWSVVIDAARELRRLLEKINLQSYLRTTGGKGLHLVVPIVPKHEWPLVKRFARGIAEAMVRQTPQRYVATPSKARRKGKIFVDYLRNDRTATAIANYSTRAREGATVATPLRWKELTKRLQPAKFTVSSVPNRLARLGTDPWEEFESSRQDLPV